MENNKTTTKVLEKQPVKKPRATNLESTNNNNNNESIKKDDFIEFLHSVVLFMLVGFLFIVLMNGLIFTLKNFDSLVKKVNDYEGKISLFEKPSDIEIKDIRKDDMDFIFKGDALQNVSTIEDEIAKFEKMANFARETVKVEVKNVDIEIKNMGLNVSVSPSEAKRIIDEHSSSQVIKILIGEDKENNNKGESNGE